MQLFTGIVVLFAAVYSAAAAPACREACPMIFRPTCGSNGRTYSNPCELGVDACKKGTHIAVLFSGACEKRPVHFNALRPVHVAKPTLLTNIKKPEIVHFKDLLPKPTLYVEAAKQPQIVHFKDLLPVAVPALFKDTKQPEAVHFMNVMPKPTLLMENKKPEAVHFMNVMPKPTLLMEAKQPQIVHFKDLLPKPTLMVNNEKPQIDALPKPTLYVNAKKPEIVHFKDLLPKPTLVGDVKKPQIAFFKDRRAPPVPTLL